MSFSALRDIFVGRVGTGDCVEALLSLKSPNKARQYLVRVHNVVFPDGDIYKNERWKVYPCGSSSIIPINERNLSDPEFMKKQADKLSFDISRFTDFLAGYTKVDDDVKPMMLHYSMIYLFDFFSRTWLKYAQNWGHGLKIRPGTEGHFVRIKESGIFQRAVDAFYFLGHSSLFSCDQDSGIEYQLNLSEEIISEKIDKLKYSDAPEIILSHLIDVYERLNETVGHVSKSNPILVGYVILFAVSSISRYYAEDWFKILEDRDLKNKVDRVQYDFLYEWTPEILMQTILKKGKTYEIT